MGGYDSTWAVGSSHIGQWLYQAYVLLLLLCFDVRGKGFNEATCPSAEADSNVGDN
jgi:hypothetical protein